MTADLIFTIAYGLFCLALGYFTGRKKGIDVAARHCARQFDMAISVDRLCRELQVDGKGLASLLIMARQAAGQEVSDPLVDLAWACSHVGLLKAAKERKG